MRRLARITAAAVIGAVLGIGAGKAIETAVGVPPTPAKQQRPGVVLGPATMVLRVPCVSRSGGWWRCTLDTGQPGWRPAVIRVRAYEDGSAAARAVRP